MPEHMERGGSGDVHSRMSATGGQREEIDVVYTPDREVSGMEQASDRPQDVMGQAKTQAEDAMSQAKEQAQNLASQAKERMGDMGERASDMASRAKSRLEGTGVMDSIRNHPLPALGAAFAVGFMLAGSSSRHQHKRGAMSMVRRQVRSAVMGGVTAALAHEARSMMGMQDGSGSGGGLLGSLFGSMQGGSSQGQGSSRSRSSGSTSQRTQASQHYH